MPDSAEAIPERVFGLALAAVTLFGVGLRAVHLDIPMRYDESVTYLAYASRGWEHITTSYAQPNNHVLHTLLVHWLTSAFGDAPSIIRLPAFVSGCALVPATAWAGRQLYSREGGLMTAVLVATSPILIEFSTNARGYTLMALCVVLAIVAGARILQDRWWVAWIGLVEVGVVGFFTLPVMTIPWLGLTMWLAVSLYRQGATARDRVRGIGTLLLANLAIGLLVRALYAGILAGGGIEAIAANRFIEGDRLAAFAIDSFGSMGPILSHWSRGMPPVLVGVVAVSVGAGLVLGRRRREPIVLVASLAIGVAVTMSVVRNWGEPRIWLWMVPVLSILAGGGVVEVTRRLATRRHVTAMTLVATAWSVAMCVQLAIAQPVRASTETGVFPEIHEVLEELTPRYRIDDAVMGDFVAVEPLQYYLARWAASNDVPGRSAVRRTWVVLDGGAQDRAQNVRIRLASAGAPPLSAITPVFTVDRIWVYLIGQVADPPDDRLLSAIDRHAGVAGPVDEERAGALLAEVVADTDSPRARMWMARCTLLGCMALAPDRQRAERLAVAAIEEVRELAVAGDREATFLLGTAYEHGLGEAVDSLSAIDAYRRAAEAGHVLAARLLPR